jgi:bifunctional non-homologous end joining protein LigD
MSLRDYARKRKFGSTPEPADDRGAGKRGKQPIFVVQLHHASHRHYDFRLEVDGALKSWAVPKGPSLRVGERRLAVEVEDHPLSYASFEGDIPEGNYGAGHVQVFDHGTWSCKDEPLAAIAAGKLDFVLHGDKLKGGWKLVRTRKDAGKPQWLLFKRDDEQAADLDADALVDAPPARRAASAALRKTAVQKTAARKRAAAKPQAAAAGKDWRARAAALDGARPASGKVAFTPQLCSSRPTAPKGEVWLHELNWDGYRLLAELDAGKVTLRTRNGLDWTAKFAGIAEAIARLPVDHATLDGELVALDDQGRSDFSALQRALKARDSSALRFLVFDLPRLAGIDLSASRLLDRKQLLEALLAAAPSAELAYSRHIVGHGDKVFAASKGQGVEGIISKQVDAPYVQARTATWVKVKHEDTDDFVVVGYTAPKGSRSGFGSLLMARRDQGVLVYAGRVGTGYDEDTLRSLLKRMSTLRQKQATVAIPAHATIAARDVHWLKPVLVAEVAFRGWGKEGLLRQAAFKRLREDKDVGELGGEAVVDVKITHPERLVYKSAKVSKGQVADYYRAVAPWLLPELANRPLSLLRCPDGADGTCFFQKHYLASLGSGVKAIKLRQKDGEEDYIYVDDLQGLLALVQMNTLELHPWGSKIDAPEQPDRLVFDLDPDEGIAWKEVVAAARDVRARLREAGLESFVRLTGGKGLHVVAPIDRGPSWEQVKHFCESFANAMVAHRPQVYVATMSKAKRSGRIFIDWLRNTRGATSVTSWSLRARAGAPVAVPVRWQDLGRIAGSNAFDIASATRRAAGLRDDPWAEIYRTRQALPG